MENPLYFEDARIWLESYLENERQFLKLTAIGLLIVAALALAAGMYVFGWYSIVGLIVLVGPAYWICGGFRSEE
ncbi:MAG: hypothetical protein V3V10_08175, partial [Planctomycetota bacterium]